MRVFVCVRVCLYVRVDMCPRLHDFTRREIQGKRWDPGVKSHGSSTRFTPTNNSIEIRVNPRGRALSRPVGLLVCQHLLRGQALHHRKAMVAKAKQSISPSFRRPPGSGKFSPRQGVRSFKGRLRRVSSKWYWYHEKRGSYPGHGASSPPALLTPQNMPLNRFSYLKQGLYISSICCSEKKKNCCRYSTRTEPYFYLEDSCFYGAWPMDN